MAPPHRTDGRRDDLPRTRDNWLPDKPPPTTGRLPPHVAKAPLTTTLGAVVGDKLRALPEGSVVRVNPAFVPPANRPEDKPEHKRSRKPKVFLGAHERRACCIDYHALGPQGAAEKWNVTAHAIQNWIALARAVASGDTSLVPAKFPILGATSEGSTPRTAQALLDECQRAVVGARPSDLPPPPAKSEPPPPEPERLPPPPPLPAATSEDRDIRVLELKSRISGLEAEINRLTMQLRDSDARCEKLRTVINTLTEKG